MTAIATSVIQNNNSGSVIKFVGTGTSTVTLASLVNTTTKSCSTTNGTAIVNIKPGADNVGVIVGGAVSGTGIPGGTTVLSINKNAITLSANATATNATVTLTFDTQKVNSGATVSIEKIYFSTSAGIAVKKGTTLMMNLWGSDHWNLNELSILETIDTNVVITTTTDDTVILKLKKMGNWGNDHYSYGNI